MAEFYPIPIPAAEAKKLEDLGLIAKDLDEAIALCSLFLETNGDLVRKGLSVAAVVAYFRCFEGPRGNHLPKRADFLDSHGRAEHRYFRHMRKQVAAHAGYDWARSYATVTVVKEDGMPPRVVEPRPTWVGQWVVHASGQDVWRLKTLAEVVAKHVRALIELETARLEAVVSALPVRFLARDRMIAVKSLQLNVPADDS